MIKRIIASDLVATLLSSALQVYIYWFAYQIFLDQFMIAFIGLGQLSGTFLATLGGGLSDKFNKLTFIKRLRLGKFLLLGLTLSLYPFVSLKILLPFFMLLSTIVGNLLAPSLESLIPFLVEEERRLFRVNALINSLTQVATILSMFLSAGYVYFLDFPMVIVVSLVLALLSYILLFSCQVDTPIQDQSVFKAIGNGLVYIRDTPAIVQLIPVALVANFSFWSIYLLLPKLTTDAFSFLTSAYSFLEMAFALGGITAGVLFARYFSHFASKYRFFRLTLIAQSGILFLLGLALAVYDGWLAYGFLLACWFVYACLNTIFSIIYFGQLQVQIPREIIGSVFGSLLTLFSLLNPLAALMSGILVSYASIPVLILIFASLMLSASLSISLFPKIKASFE